MDQYFLMMKELGRLNRLVDEVKTFDYKHREGKFTKNPYTDFEVLEDFIREVIEKETEE